MFTERTVLIEQRTGFASVEVPETAPPRYSLLYVSGWLEEDNEPEGGRVLGGFGRFVEAYARLMECRRAGAMLAWLYGPGHLVLTRRDGTPLLAPTLPRVRCADPEGEEESTLVIGS